VGTGLFCLRTRESFRHVKPKLTKLLQVSYNAFQICGGQRLSKMENPLELGRFGTRKVRCTSERDLALAYASYPINIAVLNGMAYGRPGLAERSGNGPRSILRNRSMEPTHDLGDGDNAADSSKLGLEESLVTDFVFLH
jgi:hypothetical protein